MDFSDNVICPPFVSPEECNTHEETYEYLGLFHPESALAMEAWMIPTFVMNTAFYFSNMNYF